MPPIFSTGGLGSNPQRIAISPNGTFLYVTNRSLNEVAGFTIGTNGLLTATTPATFSTGSSTSPVGISINPTGEFVYVANSSASNVAGFRISTSGNLVATTPPTVSTSSSTPTGIATPGRP